MNLALRNRQMTAVLIAAVLMTVLALTFVALSVAHINLWQTIGGTNAIIHLM